ncbi:MAG: RHS repeat-associated core domain-containing protein, partial [Azonexus sp.]|nr:RHS repeat-associated core domain-containing protein [Azonexus sp.]
TDALGRTTRTERDPASNPTRTTRADGSVVTRTFDARGNVLSQTEQANGATTTWTYDEFDQVTSTTDPRGHTTTFERDARGNLSRIIDPLGHATMMEYNAQGLMTRRVDPNGLETVIEYNAMGLATRRSETPLNDSGQARVSLFEHTPFGEPSRITSPTGTVRIFSHDAKGRPVAIEDNLSQRTEIDYDAAGNLIRTEIFDADGTLVAWQQQSFDEEDRLTETRAPHIEGLDSVVQFAYDGEGNQIGIVDPNGRITVSEFDAGNRLIRSTDPVGHSTVFVYDTRNQLIRFIAPSQIATSFDYDALARQTAEHSPDRGTIRLDYDRSDNPIASTDARGIKREMVYDPLNRLTAVTFPEPGEDIISAYDNCSYGIGRLCQIDDESGALNYEYDAFGNIVRSRKVELGFEYMTEYEYDREDRLIAINYPSGRRIEYQRDILGRIIGVHAEVDGRIQPILTNIRYRADGQLISARFGNGVTQTRRYDLRSRLVEQDLLDDGGSIIDARRYDYDPAGNIAARTGTPGDQRYVYDELDRLVGQDIATDDKAWHYEYDPNHNRQRRSDVGVLNEVYSYQPRTNRLIEIEKLLDQIEANRPTARRFTYNQAGRLAEYIEDSVIRTEYTNNALGQRTRKVLSEETKLFHYDTGTRLISETDAEGNSIKDYIWLGSEPLAQIESTGLVTYLHTDHLQTPRMGSSDAQDIVWRWEGEAFGNTDAQGVIEVNLRFPGQYFDEESELHYNHFRDYDSGIGRYTQSDPVGLVGGLNTYAYVIGNPIVYFDPSGLQLTGEWVRQPFPQVYDVNVPVGQARRPDDWWKFWNHGFAYSAMEHLVNVRVGFQWEVRCTDSNGCGRSDSRDWNVTGGWADWV